MHVKVNGDSLSLSSETKNVTALLETLGVAHKLVIVEQNGQILMKSDWELAIVRENDVFEIVHFVGGG
ncbi:MAG: sulfur carrier protein ThiS [Bacilli bacterium]